MQANMRMFGKKSFSWGVVVLVLCFCFPVGVWMLVKKLKEEPLGYSANGRGLAIFGIALIVIAVMAVPMGLSGYVEFESGESRLLYLIICGAGFPAGGLFAIFMGRNYMRLGARFDRYAMIVLSAPGPGEGYIPRIASAYPVPYETAVSELQEMVSRGFFPGAYIDYGLQLLVLPGAGSRTKNRTAVCERCCASNALPPGAPDVCEYCGSPL